MFEINFTEIWEKLKGDSTSLIINLCESLFVIVLARVIMGRITAYTSRTIEKAKKMEDKDKSKQLVTLMTVTRSISRYIVYFLVILFILNQLGFSKSVDSILVTAGIGSLIISLGAQNIIKDMLAGIFIIFEHQYAVGDYVKIGNHTGTVTSIAMRLTYLTNDEGQKVVIPNGQVTSVINYGSEYNLARVVVPTKYTDDTREAISLLEKMCEKYYKNNKEFFVAPPEVLGITQFSAVSCDVTIIARVHPLKQWKVERELRLLAKETLEQNGMPLK